MEKKKAVVQPKRKLRAPRKLSRPPPALSEIVARFPTALPDEVNGAVLGASATSVGGSRSYELLLIETMLGIAIVCFGLAVTPAAYVRWRSLSAFVLHRHLDMTLLGFLFLVLAAVGLLLKDTL
jgi:hypothetical protein